MSLAPTDLPRRHRLTVSDYYRMAEVGILAPDARVELIDGDIIDMPPPGSLHAVTVRRLNKLLVRAVGDSASVLGSSGTVRRSRARTSSSTSRISAPPSRCPRYPESSSI